MFTLTDVDDLVEQLVAADIRADTDPAAVNLPGVWVQVAQFEPHTLAAFRTEVRLQLITGDRDSRRVMEDLVSLLNQVAGVIGPRPARARTVLLPGDQPTRLPALEITLQLHTEFTTPPPAP